MPHIVVTSEQLKMLHVLQNAILTQDRVWMDHSPLYIVLRHDQEEERKIDGVETASLSLDEAEIYRRKEEVSRDRRYTIFAASLQRLPMMRQLRDFIENLPLETLTSACDAPIEQPTYLNLQKEVA